MMAAIHSAAVLGAGTMGAQIAAHLANAGIQVLLLDLSSELSRRGLERARTLKPDPFFTPDAAALITTGAFDPDLGRIARVDWVIEAVVERIEVKRPLLEQIDRVRGPKGIVSSNTSGIPLAELGESRSDGFRRHWLGTHFFNPPRYLRLLEIIPTAETDPSVVDRISRFADYGLGKGVVIAKDTPNFIANRIGVYGAIRTLRLLEQGEFSIEEIDAMTGPIFGRPKSATFRTLDIAGIDVLASVAANLTERLPEADAAQTFAVPPLVQALVDRGWLGEKTGHGFYKRQPGGHSSPEILTLDPRTLTYRATERPQIAALDRARAIADVRERTRTLFLGSDRVGVFLRQTLGSTLLYAASVAPSIANSIDDVDRAMRWGFGWELGPFELWDAIGVREVVAALGADRIPPLVAEVLAGGRNRFRERGVPPAGPGLELLRSARERGGVVRSNAGASLVDLNDGVLCVELHSKMNAIGEEAIQMLQAGIKESVANYAALVVGTEAVNFSVGANLMLLLLEAQEGNWEEIDLMIRAFQAATSALRYAAVPVVVATAGLVLGGGCEVALHGDRVQAAAESYIGLVETGVGLIPAGGGTKEMLARAVERRAPKQPDLLPPVQGVFETIGLAKISTSAADARRAGLLREVDAITMNRDRSIAEAKNTALQRVREGYQPPQPRVIEVGGESMLAALKLGIHLAWRAGRLSDHEALIGRTLASVLAGGALPHQTRVSEQYILDLEREAFLKLCGEPKTRERMQYTLKTGRTLRN
jgi:3-hydroxyacyl-CoA dehydrogenase